MGLPRSCCDPALGVPVGDTAEDQTVHQQWYLRSTYRVPGTAVHPHFPEAEPGAQGLSTLSARVGPADGRQAAALLSKSRRLCFCGPCFTNMQKEFNTRKASKVTLFNLEVEAREKPTRGRRGGKHQSL